MVMQFNRNRFYRDRQRGIARPRVDNPPAPTPFDRQLPDPNGMDNYQTTFPTTVVGGVIIGIAGKNNADAPIDFTVTVNNVPVQVLAFSGSNGRMYNSFCYMAVVPDLPIGTHTIKITPNNGSSAGTAALRIIETDPLPVGWLGATNANFGMGSAMGVSTTLNGTVIDSTVLSMVAWSSPNAYEPYCDQRISAGVYERQPTIRADLIRNTVTCGFFRATSRGSSVGLSLRAANQASDWSIALVELRGVTLR